MNKKSKLKNPSIVLGFDCCDTICFTTKDKPETKKMHTKKNTILPIYSNAINYPYFVIHPTAFCLSRCPEQEFSLEHICR